MHRAIPEAHMVRLARRRFLRLAAGATAVPAFARLARAQAFPVRPITLVVPSAAGGPSDVVARILAEPMRAALGQPLVIENVTGANGTLGAGRVARAAADGYTLCFSVSSATHVVNAAIYPLPYDVVHDFSPVVLAADNPQLILSRKTMPADDLEQLIAWLTANPGKATLGQIGPGSPAHVAGVLLQQQTGTSFTFVNYRGIGQAVSDLIAGHIDLMIYATIALEHVRAGRIKAYAVTGKRRLAIAPDIPTASEAGVPGFYAAPWFALWAPRGTPPDVIDRLNGAAVDALADPAVRKRLGDLGYEIVPREQQTPEALRAFQTAETAKWWPILKAAGIKAE
jgi:tripartite-type tricarboxylate transporter receptor subunit TctC